MNASTHSAVERLGPANGSPAVGGAIVTPENFATWTANLILSAGGKQTTAFRCALLVAEDMEARGLIDKNNL